MRDFKYFMCLGLVSVCIFTFAQDSGIQANGMIPTELPSVSPVAPVMQRQNGLVSTDQVPSLVPTELPSVSPVTPVIQLPKLQVAIKPPTDKKKIAIHNQAPFANWPELDKGSPQRIVVFINDVNGKDVTWGEVIEKKNFKNFPAIEFLEFTPPYTVRVLTNQYGYSDRFHKGVPGTAIAAWHGDNPLKGKKSYNFACFGEESCEMESKPLMNALKQVWQQKHAASSAVVPEVKPIVQPERAQIRPEQAQIQRTPGAMVQVSPTMGNQATT